jgi:DNA-directed RNA polymerase subunit RPC12/RpoP
MELAKNYEYRCECGRLLFKGTLETGKIEIKCKKCGSIKTIAYNNGSPLGGGFYVISSEIQLGGLEKNSIIGGEG